MAKSVDIDKGFTKEFSKPFGLHMAYSKALKSRYVSPVIPNEDNERLVDDSNFKTTSERKRDMILSGNIGAGERGVYDYEADSKITKENLVSDIEIALRDGKLDKADVQKLLEIYKDKAVDDIKTEQEKSALEAEEKASKNRTAAIDKQLGIEPDSVL